MRQRISVLLLLLFSIELLSDDLPAQAMRPQLALTALPPGLTVPIEIHHAIHAGSSKPGTAIIGITTQRIPVSKQLYLEPGAQLIGTVTSSKVSEPALLQPASITIQFNSIAYRHQTIPIAVRALAIANFTDVGDTHAPIGGGGDRGNPNPASWTTHQVGEDEVCRSGWIGEVINGVTQRVGFADYYGVYADSPPNSSGTAAIPHALGVFSTTARGLYGFDEGAALRSPGVEITVTSPKKLVLRSGDDLLLEVLPLPQQGSSIRQ